MTKEIRHKVTLPATPAQVYAALMDERKHARFTGAPGKSNVPKDGLMLYYNFDLRETGGVSDQSGNHRKGSLQGATIDPQGKLGGGCRFDGKNSYIEVADDAGINPRDAVSLAAWVWVKEYSPQFPSVFCKGDVGNFKESYALSITPEGNLEFLLNHTGNSSGRAKMLGPRVPLSAWTHLAATFDGSAMRAYINGEQVLTMNSSGKLSNTSGPLFIGKADRHHTGYKTAFFNGLMDEILVYNRALTAEEIRSLAAGASR